MRSRKLLALTAAAVISTATTSAISMASAGESAWRGAASDLPTLRAAVPQGGEDGINHILVVDLENESFATTFGSSSPATYLNTVLRPQGQLIDNYFATGHASLDNYISQISGQAPNGVTKADCSNLASLSPPFTGIVFGYTNVVRPGPPELPAINDPFQATNPGQTDGQGCVYPSFTPTITDQLDARYPPDPTTHVAAWRSYNGDMGNDPKRDGGTPDPTGGTDCAHPAIGTIDTAEVPAANDQYATRHNPFVYFHSITDNMAICNANVVPLGKLQATNGTPDPTGHLASDLTHEATTPRFGFITPNTCDDGHDHTCVGPNAEGGTAGGLVSADLWLKHWMPLILGSPAYRSGSMLVVVTFDEGGVTLDGKSDVRSCCYEQPGPNTVAPGDIFSKAITNNAPGGGQTGAVLLNRRFIKAGTENTVGQYNHYSALRSYEDILGLTTGGSDGLGHIGFAAAPGLIPFGPDVFNRNGG
jgi:phosphatidylinositol-3-phosphatase